MMPRVLMYGWEFPPHNSGGLGTACAGLSRALVELGVDLTFVLPKPLAVSESFCRLVCTDCQMETVVVGSTLYPYVTSDSYRNSPLGIYGWTLFEEVTRYGQLAGTIAREYPHDVIHAHDWLSFPAGLSARATSGQPLIVHVHATEFDRTGGRSVNEAVYTVEQQGMREADHIVAVSNRTKQMIIREYGIPAKKITTVYNGIDQTKEIQGTSRTIEGLKTAGRKIVLFVGRLTLQKGPDYFITLADRIAKLEPDAYFVIAGSGDMLAQIMQQAAALGLADRVLFTGFLRGAELSNLYRLADVYVLPSVSEPFGITPLEAAAAGTPVIVSKQSGVAEVMTHALKADFWDIDAMANQIVTLLRYPALAATLSEHAAKDLGTLSWKRAAATCLGLYQNLQKA